jgi:hypothetical protein
MIPIIGLMIGLYILARYAEMSRNAGVGAKIVLAIFTIVTVFCIASILLASANIENAFK